MVKENLRKKWRRGQLSDGREARRFRNTEGKDVDSSQGRTRLIVLRTAKRSSRVIDLKYFNWP